jgi:hypothetical protein
MSTEHRRQNRKHETAEDFTPSLLANEILDKLQEYGPEAWLPNKTFLDPACGNGGLLIPVLQRKLSLGHDPSTALSTLYGCDIMRDNIRECRLRLLKEVQDTGTEITEEHIKNVFNQIVLTPLNRFPGGALGYDFSFPKKASSKDVASWLDGIRNHNWLNDPSSSTSQMAHVDEEVADADADDFFNL